MTQANKPILINDTDLMVDLGAILAPSKRQCVKMLRWWQGPPFMLSLAQIAVLHGATVEKVANWMSSEKDLSQPTKKLIWLLWSLFNQREKLYSLRSVAMFGKVP
jgi:hypothetical protein